MLRFSITAGILQVMALGLMPSTSRADDSMDVYEAAAEMHTHVKAADMMLSKCGAVAPASRAGYLADVEIWRKKDALAMRRAAALWNEMEYASPQSDADHERDRREFERLWATMSDVNRDDRVAIVESRCHAYFEALAHGKWRSSDPEMYAALER